MSQLADFRCLEEDCKHEWEYTKESVKDNFPEHPECPECGSINTHRIWAKSKVTTDVAEGRNGVGNYPSKIGRFKGATVKTIS